MMPSVTLKASGWPRGVLSPVYRDPAGHTPPPPPRPPPQRSWGGGWSVAVGQQDDCPAETCWLELLLSRRWSPGLHTQTGGEMDYLEQVRDGATGAAILTEVSWPVRSAVRKKPIRRHKLCFCRTNCIFFCGCLAENGKLDFSCSSKGRNHWFYWFTFVGQAADGLFALDVPDTNRLIMWPRQQECPVHWHGDTRDHVPTGDNKGHTFRESPQVTAT